MSISFKVEDVEISAKRDRAMFNTFAGNHSYVIQGIGDELSVTSSSSSFQVTLGTGEAIICGGSMLSEGAATTLTLSENQSGYLVIRIDLSQTGDNICQFTNVSLLVQEDINDNGLIYDLPLYTYTTNGNGVSAISDVRDIVASASVYVTDTLARVATTGNYADLSNRPTIPSVDSALSSSSTNPVQNKVINTALSGKANSSHSHGNITNGGDITTNATIANGDRLVINDDSASKLVNSSITFDGSTTTQFLSKKGTWQSQTDYGNVTTSGTMTSSGVALANGDSLVFVDSSASSKLAKTSITFDGSTTTQFLSKKGTWATPSGTPTYVTWTQVWTNSSTSSAFPGQTITVDLSGYAFVGVQCQASTSDTGNRWEFIPVPTGTGTVNSTFVFASFNTSGNPTVGRYIGVKKTGVTFGPSTSVYGTNKDAIPVRIYAFK